MTKIVVALGVLMGLSACSCPNKIIITSMEGGGWVNSLYGLGAKGCTVYTQGNIEGVTIEYTDANCTVIYEK